MKHLAPDLKQSIKTPAFEAELLNRLWSKFGAFLIAVQIGTFLVKKGTSDPVQIGTRLKIWRIIGKFWQHIELGS